MKKSKENCEHYIWGDNCSGWHLVKSDSLSVIEELMLPKTSEVRHYHEEAQQFFYILSGKAIFEIENEELCVEKGDGIHIKSKMRHRIRNDENTNLEFLVISQPTSRGDRIDVT